MDEHERALLLSVRPQFAESILDGSKTAEIRRQRPNVRPGTLVIIYATKPKGAIVGTARVSGMSQGTPDEIWERHKAHVGISREDFDNYLDGTTTAYALLLKRMQRLVPFLTLEEMRAATSFQPPQSYRYVTQKMLDSLVSGHPESASLLSMLQY
jgi:predicted transcriptional regulator